MNLLLYQEQNKHGPQANEEHGNRPEQILALGVGVDGRNEVGARHVNETAGGNRKRHRGSASGVASNEKGCPNPQHRREPNGKVEPHRSSTGVSGVDEDAVIRGLVGDLVQSNRKQRGSSNHWTGQERGTNEGAIDEVVDAVRDQAERTNWENMGRLELRFRLGKGHLEEKECEGASEHEKPDPRRVLPGGVTVGDQMNTGVPQEGANGEGENWGNDLLKKLIAQPKGDHADKGEYRDPHRSKNCQPGVSRGHLRKRVSEERISSERFSSGSSVQQS